MVDLFAGRGLGATAAVDVCCVHGTCPDGAVDSMRALRVNVAAAQLFGPCTGAKIRDNVALRR